MSKKPWLVQKNIDELISGNRIIFVYTENGAYLGEAAIVFNNGDPDYTIPGKRLYLSRMIVKPSERSRGIGGILIDYICDYAIAQGYTELALGVNKDNIAARHLYEKKGFNIILFDGADEMGEYFKLLKILK
jgi:ribosomal protein S18 acetylase RimI-like enzyme